MIDISKINNQNKPRRLLVLELRMLGDAVTSLPFIQAALNKYEIYVCCTEAATEIFYNIVPDDHLIPWTPPWLDEERKYRWSKKRKWRLRKLLANLKKINADMTVSAWADARIQALMLLSNIPIRVGFPMNKNNYLAHERPWRKRQLFVGRLFGLLLSLICFKPNLNLKINRHNYRQSHIEDWHQIAQELDIPWNIQIPWIREGQATNSLDRTKLVSLFSSVKAAGKKLWLVHPGARLASKRWPLENFQKLVDSAFVPLGLYLVMIRPPDCNSLKGHADNKILIETRNIRDLIYVISNADNIICNDSLVSHLGSALGKRVITIFGSGNSTWFAPYGNEDLVVNDNSCPYKPCMDRCEMPSYVCLESITVEMVQKAMNRIM